MKSSRILRHVAALSFLTGSLPVFAQFVPGPNPITGTVGAQTLATGSGTIAVGGAISLTSGGATALTMTGTSTLTNSGIIQTTGSGRAIDSNVAGANLTLTNTGLISSATSDAFRLNTNSVVLLTNSGTIRVTDGGQAIDWAAITSASNTLINQFGGVISAIGDDAVRPGNNGIINNAGTITATPTGGAAPSGSDGIDLRTEKNVSVTNSGTISGRHGIATDGANAGPSSLTLNNTGTVFALNGSGVNIDGVALNVTANVTNAFGGTIRGGVLASATEGDGDGIDVDGVLTLNNAGNVLGLGAKGAGNNAEGLAIGGGNITNTATGQIIGSTLLVDAPNGDVTKAGNGILVDNSSGGNAIAATTIINSGLIQGKSGFGIKMIGAFDDTITNNAGGTIRGAGAAAAIQSGDGADTVNNSGTLQHDTGGTALALEGGNDTLNVTGGTAAILGQIDGGAGTNTMNVIPGSGNTFSFAGQITNFNSVNVGPGAFNLADTAAVNAAVIVNLGGILKGTGSILQSVTVQNGGAIAASSGPGVLDIGGNLNLRGGSVFRFELGALPGNLGLVAVSGFLTFAGPGSVLFDITDAGLHAGTYELITFAGASGLSLADLELGIMPPGFAGNLMLDGNSVSLVVTAVPEPATVAGVVGLTLVLTVTRLYRRQRVSRQLRHSA